MIGNLGRRWGSDGGGGEAVELARRQWEAVREFIPDSLRRADGRGRLWRDSREVLEGIVWVLRSGRAGRTCRSASRPIRLVIGASSTG
jgi:transposase